MGSLFVGMLLSGGWKPASMQFRLKITQQRQGRSAVRHHLEWPFAIAWNARSGCRGTGVRDRLEWPFGIACITQPAYPGAPDNPRFRLEYLADLDVVDSEFRVAPQFDPAPHEEFFKTWIEPEVYQPYLGVDLGYHNHTAVVFGLLDYRAGVLVILDEFSGSQMTSRRIAEAIREKEQELWGNRPSHLPPLLHPRRICDNSNPQMISDFAVEYGIALEPVRKTTKVGMLNTLNLHLDEHQPAGVKIRVHPRCTKLWGQLQDGLWNSTRTDYAKSTDGSHLDLIDALTYLNLEVDWTQSPYQQIKYNPDRVFVPPRQTRTARDMLFGG